MKRFGKPPPMFPPFPEGSRVIFYGDIARFLRAPRGGVARLDAD